MSTDVSLHHRRRAPLPGELAAIPWLVVNALVCLFVSRAMLKKAA